MPTSVYLETTIAGAYFDERDDVVSRFQSYQTRLWWATCRPRYDLYTSEAVVAEINRRLGLLTPTILTPQMLVEEDSSERERE